MKILCPCLLLKDSTFKDKHLFPHLSRLTSFYIYMCVCISPPYQYKITTVPIFCWSVILSWNADMYCQFKSRVTRKKIKIFCAICKDIKFKVNVRISFFFLFLYHSNFYFALNIGPDVLWFVGASSINYIEKKGCIGFNHNILVIRF